MAGCQLALLPEANADTVADRLIRMMPHLIDAIDDRDARDYLGDTLGRQLGTIDLAPILGRAITVLMADGSHASLIDRFFDHCREFLTNREDQLYAAAEIQRRRWWIPKAVNRPIAKAIIGGVKEIISNLREPGGVARQNLLRGIEHLAQELCASPEYRARVEEAKLRLLEDARACVAVGPRFHRRNSSLLIHRWSKADPNHRSLSRGFAVIFGEEKGPQAISVVSKDFAF